MTTLYFDNNANPTEELQHSEGNKKAGVSATQGEGGETKKEKTSSAKEKQQQDGDQNNSSAGKGKAGKGKKKDDQKKEEAKKPPETQAIIPEEQQRIVEACLNENLPLLLIGETGTGKTTLIKYMSEVREQPLTRINITGQTGREDLIGKYTLINGNMVWQEGPLLHAIKNGHIVLLDEVNAALPDVLFTLQALLERNHKTKQLGDILLSEKDGEVVTPHPETRICATMNPPTYGGVKALNTATASRFISVTIHPLSTEEEANLIEQRYGNGVKKSMVGICKAIACYRQAWTDRNVVTYIGTRDVEQVAQLILLGIPNKEAVSTLLDKLTIEYDREVLRGYINEHAQAASHIDALDAHLKERFDVAAITLQSGLQEAKDELDRREKAANQLRQLINSVTS